MEEGRELDALVAEKVMGWKKTPFDNYPWQMLPPDAVELKVKSCPRYSTDIAAAWQVVEKLCILPDGEISLTFWDGLWNCHFDDPTGSATSVSTAPLAICLAALKAMKEHGSDIARCQGRK